MHQKCHDRNTESLPCLPFFPSILIKTVPFEVAEAAHRAFCVQLLLGRSSETLIQLPDFVVLIGYLKIYVRPPV